MRFFVRSPRGCRVAFGFIFAAQLLMAGVVLPSNARAQDAGNAPPPPPEQPPPPAVFENRIPGDQLAFLNDYAGKMERDLLKDKRFHNLMKLVTPRTGYFYGGNMALSEASGDVLDADPLPVDIRDGRYVMVATHGGGFHGGRGFMWFDMKEGIGLGGVYFHPTNGEPTPTLAVFSRQLRDRSLFIGQLPPAFVEDLNQWVLISAMPTVTVRYFIPENGKKYVLVHDEDYCWHPENTPAPNQDRCEELNAEAADADLNAADFMAQTNNAANATAWMLSPTQVAWIGVRDQTCGGAVACRIRLTRQRTRVILQKR